MKFEGAIKTCFRKYITFSGRASKAEFWYFILFLFLGSLACIILNGLYFGPEVMQKIAIPTESNPVVDTTPKTLLKFNGGWLSDIFGIATILPWFAVTWRRLHDSDKAGWRALLPIPFFLLTIGLMNIFSELVPLDISHFPSSITETLTETPMIQTPTNLAMYFGGIPFIFGAIILVIFWLTRPSTPGPNTYGPNPNEVPT